MMKSTQALFMTSAQVFCFCCRIRLELKFRCLSWHALTGLLLGLRGLCPGFFLLGLLPTLLYLKQSVIKSARISMLPYSLWDRIFAQMVTLEHNWIQTHLTGLQSARSSFPCLMWVLWRTGQHADNGLRVQNTLCVLRSTTVSPIWTSVLQ